ncbi:MAG: NnrS family protein [Spirochaetales bacterium]|nr:NnrS family protein [Spirochaetales bacterium]MCP5486427.1 NnrS family protein [Spirochaetales bacterium]
MLHYLRNSPYLFFFPIGIFGAALGGALWLEQPPVLALLWHKELMISGFLLPIATGFLLTNLHRFLHRGGQPPGIAIVLGFLVWVLGLFGAFLFQARLIFLALNAGLISGLIAYAFSRGLLVALPRLRIAPFLIAGLLLGLSGSLMRLFVALGLVPSFWEGLGVQCFHHGFFWLLICGFGQAMFPMLTLSTMRPDRLRVWRQRLQASARTAPLVAFGLAASFVSAHDSLLPFALGLRAVLLLFVAWNGWMLFDRSGRRGVVTFFLKASLLTAVFGHFILPFFPEYFVHLSHIGLLAGFGLVTMVVVGRVYLSRVGAVAAELRAFWFAGAFSVLHLALWTRVTAFLLRSYWIHIQIAALLWLFGLGLWCAGLFWTLVRARQGPRSPGDSSKRSGQVRSVSSV